MKTNLTRRLKVYDNTIASLDKHLHVWQHVKEMSRTQDRFVRNFKKLTDHREVLDRDLQSGRDKHMRICKELAGRIIPVIGVVSMYAEDQGNKALKKQFSVKAREVEEMKAPRLLSLSEAVISLSQNVKKGKSKKLNPSDYGLTVEMTEGIRTKSEELKESLAALKAAGREKKKSTRAARRLIKRNDNLLKSRTDKFVRLFRKSDPAFYQDYKQARKSQPSKPDASSQTSKAKPSAEAKPKLQPKPQPKSEGAETA